MENKYKDIDVSFSDSDERYSVIRAYYAPKFTIDELEDIIKKAKNMNATHFYILVDTDTFYGQVEVDKVEVRFCIEQDN